VRRSGIDDADLPPARLEIARGNIEEGVEWIESPCDALPFMSACT
jgi:hypothetical protein